MLGWAAKRLVELVIVYIPDDIETLPPRLFRHPSLQGEIPVVCRDLRQFGTLFTRACRCQSRSNFWLV